MSARNAYKGYSYQNWVTFCLVQKMDLRKEIVQIDSEINVHDNFDDIYIKTKNEEFYCQVKNWKNADINEVKITDKKIKFKDYDPIEYTPNKNNIVILNKDFETDTEILGIKAKLINSIYFVPLTENNKENQIEHYIDINRKDQIKSIFDDRTINEHFKICLKDLPELKSFSTELKEETILLNEIVDEIERGTKWVIGEPGIGKSHIVTEYENKFEDLIIYRFYTNSFDNDYDDRLEYENFIKDLIYKVFKTPEKHTEEELIQQLKKIDKPIIIDGLDHVENYRSRELKKYFNFIKKLTNLRVLIFSRPLLDFPENIQISHLEKWTKNQTMYYLKEKYSFNNRIKDKIYQIASGYPIITYYLSEHVKNGGSFNDYSKIETITDYYDKIMEGVKTKSALSLFLITNSYFLEKEIKELLDKNMSNVVYEFIEDYPFLFSKELNRIQLFHDSLITYLRETDDSDNKIIEKIKQSILNKNINYLARFNSFNFDLEFKEEVLKLYSDFNTFKEISKNYDFESIKIFYTQLKKVLVKFPNSILNIYQYYSFILITFLIERSDYHALPELFYQIFKYGEIHGFDENDIYSNKVMWNLYLYYKNGDLTSYKRLLDEIFYDTNSIISGLENIWNDEKSWKIKTNLQDISDEEIRKQIQESIYRHYSLEDYLAHIWINEIKESPYYSLIDKYVSDNFYEKDYQDLCDICEKLDIPYFFRKKILPHAKIKIMAKGHLENENIFLNQDLKEFMRSVPEKYSCDIYPYLVMYMRLYNYLEKDFYYEEIFNFLNMYYFRKDYSVINLDTALLTFEKHDCIDEDTSIQLIKNTMEKSEKGIRGLIWDYLNRKNVSLILKLLTEDESILDGLYCLSPKILNRIPEHLITSNMLKILATNRIDFNEIENIFNSKHQNLLIKNLKDYEIDNIPKNVSSIFEEHGIKYSIKEEKILSSLKERGYLIRDDLEVIQENNLTYMELSTYADGYYHCLPYPQFYEIYSKRSLRNDYLNIIHSAISEIHLSEEYPNIWDLCLGNIPLFLDIINIDVDWNKLFNIFKKFIKYSSIPNDIDNKKNVTEP